MISKHREMQLLIHQYRDEVGRTDVYMHEVAEWAVNKGYLKPPKPIAPLDVLAKELSKAAREETKIDPKTYRSYRVNHARMEMRAGKPVTLWGDIDKLQRDPMRKCFIQRRQQMVGDAVQLNQYIRGFNFVSRVVRPLEFFGHYGLQCGPGLWRQNAFHPERPHKGG
jgi:hypothetical protein